MAGIANSLRKERSLAPISPR
jgi:hypothetical protein